MWGGCLLGHTDSRVRRSIYFLCRLIGVLVIPQVSISMFSRSLQTLRSLNFPDSSRAPTIQNQLKEVKRTSVWQKDRAIESMAFEITLAMQFCGVCRLAVYVARTINLANGPPRSMICHTWLFQAELDLPAESILWYGVQVRGPLLIHKITVL